MPKPKLTPSEKRELKIKKKREKKLRKEEKQRQNKRDQLTREVKYGQLTVKQYEKDWRNMLIKAALPKMREDLEFAWHNFERVIDCKDFQISLLKDELRDAEDQIMFNFTGHLENIDKLMKIFDDRLNDFKQDYDVDIRKLQNLCKLETDDTRETANENLNYVKTMLYQLALANRDHVRNKKAEYFSRLDEVEVKNQDQIQKLRAHLEQKYYNMFDNIKRFIKDHERHLKNRKAEYKKLKDVDDGLQELIGQQFLQIKNLYDTLRRLRQKFSDMKQTEGSKLIELQAERSYFSNSFIALKTQLDLDQRHDFTKLVHLSQNSGRAFDYLELLNKKGETILKLAAVCRKLETRQEKFLQFPLKEFEECREEEEESKHVKKELRMFWQRVGLVHSVLFALLKEKNFLKDESYLICNFDEKEIDQNTSQENKKVINTVDARFEMMKYRRASISYKKSNDTTMDNFFMM